MTSLTAAQVVLTRCSLKREKSIDLAGVSESRMGLQPGEVGASRLNFFGLRSLSGREPVTRWLARRCYCLFTLGTNGGCGSIAYVRPSIVTWTSEIA